MKLILGLLLGNFQLRRDLHATWSSTGPQPFHVPATILKYLWLETVGMKKLDSPFLNHLTHQRRNEEISSLR